MIRRATKGSRTTSSTLTFRATPPFASAFHLYQDIGAVGLNATTSPDTTDYFALVPASQLETALWIEARRLGLGLSSLNDDVATEERRVLLRDHEMRNGWEPGFALARATDEALFLTEHRPASARQSAGDGASTVSVAKVAFTCTPTFATGTPSLL